jgi:outer membrane protein assembly factor BamA
MLLGGWSKSVVDPRGLTIGNALTCNSAASGERTMRIAIGLVFVSSLIGTGLAQEAEKTPNNFVQVRKLMLAASDLPSGDLQPIATSLEGRTYPLDELQERIQQKLRDEGYYFARAETPQLTNVRLEGAANSADVSIQIEAGNQYRFGQITFRGTSTFPQDRLRSLFPIQAGGIFNASGVAAGLDKLKSLYEAEGYADIGAVPSIAVDEARHIIDISVEVEEGLPYLFGPLTLEGTEPSAGAGKALLTAWKELEGKRYNPEVLKKWLAANAPKVPAGAPTIHPHAEGIADPDAHLMNVRLKFE